MNTADAAFRGLLLLALVAGVTVLAVNLGREAAPGLARLLESIGPVIASAGQAIRRAFTRRRGR